MQKFRFMTGAKIYRCEALNREHALKMVRESLNPDDNTWAVICASFYQEDDGMCFESPLRDVSYSEES